MVFMFRFAVIFFLIWAVMGIVYFFHDVFRNEERWMRSEGDWVETLIAGPVIWILLLLITVFGRALMLLGYFRG